MPQRHLRGSEKESSAIVQAARLMKCLDPRIGLQRCCVFRFSVVLISLCLWPLLLVADDAGRQASDEQHWSLVPPVRVRVPGAGANCGNPIDCFIRARLEQTGLKQSEEANKATLIRRVTLDLIGLPPTLEEIDAFIADDSPNAYERLVDRLLASPRYGERMAIDWLDAARYADTHGYLFDTQRSMWRWRDWVIEAFNRDLPFDQFTMQQLAGDLLPEASASQKLATGFHRNHIINNEAGATPQEYLVENVLDRVNTTATVWMGLTLGCCQCHDHKDDPFTQREYYQLYAFFNNIPEVGLDGFNANAKPLMKAPRPRDRERLLDLRTRVNQVETKLASLAEKIDASQSAWEDAFAKKVAAPTRGLVAHWPLDQMADDTVDAGRPAVFEAAPASYSDGVLGSAASLEGLAYLNAGDRFNLTASDSFSIAAWVRPSTKAGRLTVFSRMENAKKLFRGYTLQTFAGLPAFFLLNQFPDNMIQVQGKTPLEPNQWHHLAVTYDGSGKAAGVTLYLNGEPQKPGVVVDKLSGPITTQQPFWIGNGHPAAKLKGLIDEVRVYDRVLSPDEVKQLPGLSIQSLLAVEADERNEEQKRRVREVYLEQHAPPAWRDMHRNSVELKRELERHQSSLPDVMVMQERDKPRKTNLLVGGAYNQPGEEVTAATPAALPPMREQWPKNRLGFAQWLVDPSHPLTARVAVNRLWQMHFGAGLVRTSGDFGQQGEAPSHPQLLDWLATECVRLDWDVKELQRLIVTSATYRQSSNVTPEMIARDPDNRLLARGPRHRLPAEVIRDQALSVSGLLVGEIGGPSVKPYQPEGLWREVAFDFSGANLTAQIYKQDTGSKLYRRSLYTFWKRTAPPPTMLLFDAPDRERCVVRRETTSTPLQALVLMNDPTYVEASRKLAERMMTEAGTDVDERLAYGFRLVTSRHALPHELTLLVEMYDRQLARFTKDAALVKKLLEVGEARHDEALDQRELAALTVIGNVLFNLDETITRQ